MRERHRQEDGFTLVEVLVACALLALVIVPTLRAFSVNRAAADHIVDNVEASLVNADKADKAAFDVLVDPRSHDSATLFR